VVYYSSRRSHLLLRLDISLLPRKLSQCQGGEILIEHRSRCRANCIPNDDSQPRVSRPTTLFADYGRPLWISHASGGRFESHRAEISSCTAASVNGHTRLPFEFGRSPPGRNELEGSWFAEPERSRGQLVGSGRRFGKRTGSYPLHRCGHRSRGNCGLSAQPRISFEQCPS